MNNVAQTGFPTVSPDVVFQRTEGYARELYRVMNQPPFIGLTSTNANLNEVARINDRIRIPRFRHRSQSVNFDPRNNANIPLPDQAMGKNAISFEVDLDIIQTEWATVEHEVLQQSYITDPLEQFGRTIANTLSEALRKLTVRLQRRFLENTYKCFGSTSDDDTPVASLRQLKDLQRLFSREQIYSSSRELIMIADDNVGLDISAHPDRNDRSANPEEARMAQINRLIQTLGISGTNYLGRFGSFFIFVDEDLAFNPLPYAQGPVSNGAGAIPAATVYTNGELSVRANTDFLNLNEQPLTDGGNGILLQVPVTTVGTARNSLYIPAGCLFTVTGIGQVAGNADRVFTVAQDLIIRPSYTASTGTAVTQTTGFLVIAGLPTGVQRAATGFTSVSADTDITFLGHLNTSIAFERESVVLVNRLLFSHTEEILELSEIRRRLATGPEHRFRNRHAFTSTFPGTSDILSQGSITSSGVDYGIKFRMADTRTDMAITMITTLVNIWPEFCVKIFNGARTRAAVVDPNDPFLAVPTTITPLEFRA